MKISLVLVLILVLAAALCPFAAAPLSRLQTAFPAAAANGDVTVLHSGTGKRETLPLNDYLRGVPILAAYHALSPGKTESAAVVWGRDLPYLQSVNADGDVLSPKAEQTLTLHKDAFLEAAKKLRGTNLQTTKRAPVGKCVTTDSGFVKRIRIGDRACSGAEVRDAFGLPSAFFTLKQTGDDFTFTVRGVGHGVGMSLNSADFMARQGSSHEEILAHFYPGATLAGKEDDK